jgi:hypothetical protein
MVDNYLFDPHFLVMAESISTRGHLTQKWAVYNDLFACFNQFQTRTALYDQYAILNNDIHYNLDVFMPVRLLQRVGHEVLGAVSTSDSVTTRREDLDSFATKITSAEIQSCFPPFPKCTWKSVVLARFDDLPAVYLAQKLQDLDQIPLEGPYSRCSIGSPIYVCINKGF